jgi:hypothetical protein
MARKKNPSTDIPTPEETVIEGTAEHVEDHENDTVTGTGIGCGYGRAKGFVNTFAAQIRIIPHGPAG